ncbi:uncharacterized protein [Oryza sativa Japonica Group]|uniref:Os09g0481800 protein n=2 Tax=Oryza sativa subsp. japonica TaxID=39947 RepID=Q0J0V3_ORYSJ|nr:uncharacterized protein LOC4347400 [Oryza sativa Japonica Group]KAB8111032.1 hypothetical protein EE612_048566 [Oryza sativa]KAF2916729.1 hypothetical protein DAI22_09g141400 [Oryza sativa Japonica Group]BAD33404.1 unknown protein [Oryza sativa Japonica Group]BAF25412.1 Os09g0481800 [Oryza sativa Japonica Group]BAG88405.1 unnamed protein product [Oryza sativa Japonica Group]|eukprot:NP_001063498.1 Os09g0481800 [Oryza sativa Japonica Group]
MALVTVHARLAAAASSASPPLRSAASCTRLRALSTVTGTRLSIRHQQRRRWRRPRRAAAIAASLDLNEDNVRLAIDEAKAELGQLFDTSVGITGQVDLAELDGPFVKLRLKGKFWHTRATVLARIGNYLKNRIPEILEVEIEDEKQLDDSPAAF